MKELNIDAADENLDRVREFVSAELESYGCPPKIQNKIILVAEELFVNIAHYAYTPGKGSVVVRVTVSDNEIGLEFEDEGNPYNPLKNPVPDISAPVEERPIGGLGIFMVKKIMDLAEYRYEDGRNILTLKKKIL